LFEHGRITTTETRAKRMQPLAEKLITRAKRGDLHSRRIVMKTITDPTVVHVLFTEIAKSLEKREGGYTRITKVGNRKGDNASMAVIEIITEEVTPKSKAKKADSKRPAKAADTVLVDDDALDSHEADDETDLVEEETEDTAETEQAEDDEAAEDEESAGDEKSAGDEESADDDEEK
ncbi:MAG: 50S ribosomal protein L17, partial [Propionibacteriaceae bacterium]|nr:50S ribosomal protein L17 [Propionibacteriaceae bacterium]